MVAATAPLANCVPCGRTLVECVLLSGVRPGFARPSVGGEHDGALVVRVSEPAVDGQATAAVLASAAAAFGVGRGSVTLVAGARSRAKILDVAGGNPRTLERLLAR